MTEPNRTDLPREADLHDQYIAADRGVESRNAFIDRSDQEDYQRRLNEKTNDTSYSSITKIGLLGFAAYALGKSIPKDMWIEGLNKLGLIGSRVVDGFVDARNQAIGEALGQPIAPAASRRVPKTQLGTFLQERVLPLMRDLDASLVSQDAVDIAKEQTRLAIESRFGRNPNVGGRNKVLTVADVLATNVVNGNGFSVISSDSTLALQRARSWIDPNGSWFDRIAIDSNLYRGPSGIMDIRWASLSNIGNSIGKLLDFKIPIVGFKPIDVIKPIGRLIGRGEDIGPVGPGQVLAPGITAPRTGLNYVIGGKLFNFGQGGAIDLLPKKRFSFRPQDTMGKAYNAMLGGLPIQGPAPANTFFEAIQDVLGIGPKFRTQGSAVGEILDATRRSRGVRNNTLEFKPNETIPAGELPGFPRLARLREEARQLSTLGTYNPNLHVPNPYASANLNDLPISERVSAFFNKSKYGRIVDPANGRAVASDGLFGTNVVSGGRVGQEYVMENGFLNKANTLGHFFTTRLNNLIGATTGIGFKPAQGKLGWLINGYRIWAIGALLNPMNGYLVDALQYTNYLFKQATSLFGWAPWQGFSPLSMPEKAYKYGTLAVAGIKDISGFTSAAKYSENLMPGLFNSPLSGLARTIGPAALLGMKHGPAGLLAGLGLSMLMGGPSDVFGPGAVLGAGATTSAKELYSYYTGETKVPIKNGRWWGMGRGNYYGEGVERYEPHWLKLLESNWQYSSALYGSERAYFANQSRLPTPLNLFGLRTDEDYFAKLHSLDRPYPVMPSGKLTGAADVASNPQLPRGITMNQLDALGMGPLNPNIVTPTSEEGMSIKLRKVFGNLTEFLGVYKFIGESIFGKMQTGPVLQSSSNITNENRLYWNKDLGGLFGMTELLRRYIPAPNEIGASSYVNNLPNQMPAFMPGARSQFKKDQSYYIDFTVGDPYSKVKGGEYRLPGAGYESVNQLHSGQKGVYDPVDALMILADVAPYSSAYKYYASQVRKMKLDQDWQNKVKQAIDQRSTVMQGYASDFITRKFTGSQVSSINDKIKYNALEKTIGSAWERLTLDVLPEVGRIVPFGGLVTNKLFPHYTAAQDYYYRQYLGARNSNWANPWEGFIRPKLLTLYNENPLTATAGGAIAAGMTMSGNPFNALTAGIIGSGAMGLASAARSVYYGRSEGGYKPEFRRREEAITEYFDNLEYMRYQNAKDKAYSINRPDIARQFSNLQRTRTMVGMKVSVPMFGMGAIPKPERFYVKDFMKATGKDREEVLDLVPGYMQNFYNNAWNPGSGKRVSKQALQNYFSDKPYPDQDWSGWNPAINKWQIMAMSMNTPDNSVAMDLHRVHISTAMERQATNDYPDVGVALDESIEDNRIWTFSAADKIDMTRKAINQGYRNIRVSSHPGRGYDSRSSQRFDLRQDRRKTRDEIIKENLR